MQVSAERGIPLSYNPDLHNNLFFDVTEDISLPDDKFYTVNIGNVPREQAFARGLTHLPKQLLPWPRNPDGSINYQGDWSAVNQLQDSGRTYSDVPQTNEVLAVADHGGPDQWQTFTQGGVTGTMNIRYFPTGPYTEAQAIQQGNNTGVVAHRLHVGETQEGSQYIQSGYPMWGWYNQRARQRQKERFDAIGKKSWFAHNYFTIGWPDMYYLGRNSRQFHKDAFNQPYSSWPYTLFSPGGPLNPTNLICVAVYIGHPDRKSDLLGDIWQMECIRKMGKEACIFLFAVHEWRPNNWGSLKYRPEDGPNPGTVWRQNKVPIDPGEALTYGFAGCVHGSGSAEWGAQGRVSEFTLGDDYSGKTADLWQALGSTEIQNHTHFPHYGPYHFYGYTGIGDMFAFGVRLYCKTWKFTAGGSRKFLKWRKRLAGGSWGAWKTPSNNGMDDLADAHYDEEGYVYSELKNNLLAWYYLNPRANGLKYEIEFEHPNNSAATFNTFVAGNMVKAGLINL